MRKIIAFLFFIPLLSLAQQADVLIKNGKILDGTGNSWFYGDVAVKNGEITAIGHLQHYKATRTIDAKGLIVAPGFIDVHTHIEGEETKNPSAQNFLFDGVTTVITGNCGSSSTDLAKYFAMLDSLRLSINVASLIGHNDVRKAVMGTAMRDPSEEEMKKMEMIVAQGMKDGAVGFSTGLIYIPGTYSKTEEVVRLAKVAAEYNGVYTSHMRDEGDSVTQAIEEAIQIGKAAEIPVEISHFKCSGQNNWNRSKETISMIEAARREGLDVTIDQYPYTASSTNLGTLLPDWILADGQDSINARLSLPANREKVAEHMLRRLAKRKLKHFSYPVVANFKPDTTYDGKSIEQVNLLRGKKHRARDEAYTVMDMIKQGGAAMVFHGMSDSDVNRIMRYPFNMFASDGGIRVFGQGAPHPRSYGTNARVLGKYVREDHVISLEEAVRRMSSLPAQKFQLKNRGLLRQGFAADIVVFDAATVNDRATYEKPHQYSTGFKFVLVNGQVVIENGSYNGTRSGAVLRKGL